MLAVAASFFLSQAVHADAELLRRMYRGTKQYAMGGAGVALAEDPSSFWYNPAAVAGIDSTRIHYLMLDVDGAGNLITDAPVIMAAMSDFSVSSINALMGRNTYARAQYAPVMLMPGMAVGIIAEQTFAFYAKNQALPQVTMGYQNTNGIQAAFAIPLQRRRGRRRTGDFELGVALKILWRKGGYYKLSTAEMINVAGQKMEGLHQLTGNYQFGIGADLGARYSRRVSRQVQWSLGASYVDAGDTSFGGKAKRARGNLTLGGALNYDTGPMKVIATYDFANLYEDVDWRLKNHFGFELRFPVLSIYGGINQVFLTYGVGLNVWVLELTAMSYAEELGNVAFQDPNRRFTLRLNASLSL